MEPSYPITCEQLRNYSVIHKEQQTQVFINKGIEYISTEILNKALHSKEYSCEIVINQMISDLSRRTHGHVYMNVRDGPFDSYLQLILDGVKKRFPECMFTQDPAKKYLFVSW